jgi:hypothetical protein
MFYKVAVLRGVSKTHKLHQFGLYRTNTVAFARVHFAPRHAYSHALRIMTNGGRVVPLQTVERDL